MADKERDSTKKKKKRSTRPPRKRSTTKTAAAADKPKKRQSKPKKRRSSKAATRATTTDSPEPPSADPIPPSQRQSDTNPARRLDSILRALPPKELASLIERMGIRIDKKKRIDTPAQVARALVRIPDVREPSRLPPVSAELMCRIAEANGALIVASLPAGLENLVRRGIVFAHMVEAGVELILPTAFVVQMKSWEGEDPRSLRALLAEAPFETASAIATHFLGRPSTPPIALSLEPAWEVLGNPNALRAELDRVSHQERRLLDEIEQVGGEVDTQELMDMEREPMRVRGAYGVAAGRRGAAFSLEKRGLLFPLHPNRYVIPTEVASIIGGDRRREREERREQIRSHVVEEDHLPRRAKFSVDPAPLAVAMAIAVRESSTEVRPRVGTPRSLIGRLATRFGREHNVAALVAALSRAIGLWETGVSTASPPGSLQLTELTSLLFDTWRRGGAWDEARKESEMLRVAPEHRDPSPVGVLREMVLDALLDLGEGQWVPLGALVAYLEDDPRIGGLERLFSRWGRRVGLPTPSPIEVAQRVIIESLATLGVVDLGGADVTTASGSGELTSLAVRLTGRGLRLIGRRLPETGTTGELSDARTVVVGSTTRIANVLDVAAFVDLGAVEGSLVLEVSQAAVARGLAAGIQATEMQTRLGRLAELSSELSTALEQAGTVIGRATFYGASGFLWVEDQEIRDMLLRAPTLSDLFVDPSPDGGLLVAAKVDPERLARRCRAMGVDIEVDERSLRARKSTAPRPKRATPASS